MCQPVRDSNRKKGTLHGKNKLIVTHFLMTENRGTPTKKLIRYCPGSLTSDIWDPSKIHLWSLTIKGLSWDFN